MSQVYGEQSVPWDATLAASPNMMRAGFDTELTGPDTPIFVLAADAVAQNGVDLTAEGAQEPFDDLAMYLAQKLGVEEDVRAVSALLNPNYMGDLDEAMYRFAGLLRQHVVERWGDLSSPGLGLSAKQTIVARRMIGQYRAPNGSPIERPPQTLGHMVRHSSGRPREIEQMPQHLYSGLDKLLERSFGVSLRVGATAPQVLDEVQPISTVPVTPGEARQPISRAATVPQKRRTPQATLPEKSAESRPTRVRREAAALVEELLGQVAGIPADEKNWRRLALCANADPNIFFPGPGQSAALAKQICRACVVRPACLASALEHKEPIGVWGGMTADERDLILNKGSKKSS